MIGGIPDEPVAATWEQIQSLPDESPLRCVDQEAEQRMIALIDRTKEARDTLGGIFEVAARGAIPDWDLTHNGTASWMGVSLRGSCVSTRSRLLRSGSAWRSAG
jgi:hypothetical protein